MKMHEFSTGKNKAKFRVCNSCVMDTTDPDIEFDRNGVCNHCRSFKSQQAYKWFPNEKGKKSLDQKLEIIKRNTVGSEFQGILGLSGGVDSSFLALKLKEWGIRPLVFHVDTGWNSELAVSNIEKIIRFCGFDLYTEVVDWSTMRRLQLAYLNSGLPNLDVPQDHAIFANLYNFSRKNKIKYVFSGGNFATESVFPAAWHGSAMDSINLRGVFNAYGEGGLEKFLTIHPFDYYVLSPFYYQVETLRPLNFLPYNKEQAISELIEKVSWERYDYKHGESNFTRIFQGFILPTRYGFDKRKPHLSSLILSGQISRAEAVRQLKMPLYDEQQLKRDINYFCRKLEISLDEFETAMHVCTSSHTKFPTWSNYYMVMKACQKLHYFVTGKRVHKYS